MIFVAKTMLSYSLLRTSMETSLSVSIVKVMLSHVEKTVDVKKLYVDQKYKKNFIPYSTLLTLHKDIHGHSYDAVLHLLPSWYIVSKESLLHNIKLLHH